MKAPSINDTEMPEIPGNNINRYSIPLTPITARINKNPFNGVSILIAAIIVNK
jgi:hypothetical protein